MLRIKQEIQVRPTNISCWSLGYGEPVLVLAGHDDWSLQVILTEEQLRDIAKGASEAIKTRAEKSLEKAKDILEVK